MVDKMVHIFLSEVAEEVGVEPIFSSPNKSCTYGAVPARYA